MAFAALSAACGEAEPAVAARDDVLVLELGGGHARLSEALDGARARLHAVADVDPGEVAMAAPASQSVEVVSMPAQAPPVAESAPRASPVPAVQPRRVRLEQGQTLYRLAVVHLGDGSRWRELLTLNGWTEADLARLPAGTSVRLP